MPIVDVQLVGKPAGSGRALTRRLADAAGKVFESGRHETWVKVRVLSVNGYAENGGGPPEGVRPVFVTVLRRRLPGRAALKVEIERLTRAVAAACGRPAVNVHVIYEPPASGRVAFGGRLVE